MNKHTLISQLLPLAIIATASLFLTACQQEQPVTAKVELPAVSVSVLEIQSMAALRYESLPGTVVARQQATVEAKLTGRVTALDAAPGKRVKAGEVLAVIDAPEISAKVEQARAAFDLAGKNHQRAARLFERQAATHSELDLATGQLEQARASVAEAESMLGYAQVKAPFAGTISRKQIEVGDLATPGRPLFTVEAAGNPQFTAGVPESLLGGLRMGVTNLIRIGGSSDWIPALVAEINPAGDPASRSWKVKWDLPASEATRSGAFGEVQLNNGEAPTIRIPASSVTERGQLEQVFVVTDGRAVLRLVKTGERIGDQFSVLSGLVPGERLITSPAGTIRDGQKVNY